MESEEPENVGKDMAVGAFEDFDSTSLSRISIMDLLIDAEVLGSIATRSAERTGVGLVVDAEYLLTICGYVCTWKLTQMHAP